MSIKNLAKVVLTVGGYISFLAGVIWACKDCPDNEGLSIEEYEDLYGDLCYDDDYDYYVYGQNYGR